MFSLNTPPSGIAPKRPFPNGSEASQELAGSLNQSRNGCCCADVVKEKRSKKRNGGKHLCMKDQFWREDKETNRQ
jgi:hypothetical protein